VRIGFVGFGTEIVDRVVGGEKCGRWNGGKRWWRRDWQVARGCGDVGGFDDAGGNLASDGGGSRSEFRNRNMSGRGLESDWNER
jgi:hypothetical protein